MQSRGIFGDLGRGFRHGNIVHEVNWESCLPPKHQVEWGVPSCGVNTGIICKTHLSQLFFPLKRVFLHTAGQHTQERSVESLHKSI